MRRLLVIAVVLSATDARGEEASPPRPADVAMTTYFHGETTGGYVLLAMGAGELVAGGLLVRADSDGLRGASYPMLGIGLAHAVAGIFVNLSSAKRVRVFGREIERDADDWRRREQKRMTGVSRQFLTLKIVETVLATGGIATAVLVHDDHPQLAGAGISLAVGMAATFVFDVVAAKRAHGYRRRLADLH